MSAKEDNIIYWEWFGEDSRIEPFVRCIGCKSMISIAKHHIIVKDGKLTVEQSILHENIHSDTCAHFFIKENRIIPT